MRGGAAFLTPVDFPLMDFGIAPHAVEATDTTQLLGLLVARQALIDAGYGPDRDFRRDRVSVVLGVTGTLELVIPLGARLGHPIWRRALRDEGVDDATAENVVRRISESYVGWQENSFPGLLGNVAAGRIANRLDLGGTNCVVDAACASSLGAVNLAMLELAAGRCDIALRRRPRYVQRHLHVHVLQQDAGAVALRRCPALRCRRRRHGAGRGPGNPGAEAAGRRAARRRPDLRGDPVDGHFERRQGPGGLRAQRLGTGQGPAPGLRTGGSLAADRSSWSRLMAREPGWATRSSSRPWSRCTGDASSGSPWCALGSIKSQVGHTKAAAGAAGLIKAALALHHKVLPPTIKVSQPIAPLASGDSPFYLNTESRPWLPRHGHPRRAAVSAFGFGGSNFHCLLEEAGPEAGRHRLGR